jgi:two-component system, OmpR family, sensor histidine kinase VicK
VMEFVAPESRNLVLSNIRARLGAPTEVVGLRADGSTFPAHARGRAAPYQGRLARMVALRDISELKEAERELRVALALEKEAAGRLRQLDDLKDTFLRAVSHDLRTPLAVILWLAQALAEGRPPLTPDQSREFLERIAANAKSLDRLVLDLLDLDRLSQGRLELRLEPTDVGALVRRVAEGLDVAKDREVTIETESVTVPADPSMVERMAENLLINAIRHTSVGTPLWVMVRPDEEGGALIVVEDAGVGIPKEQRQEIFEPLRRGPSDRGSGSGLGIGLSLVARFATLHGGRAWVEDREGGGASFRVLLPKARFD